VRAGWGNPTHDGPELRGEEVEQAGQHHAGNQHGHPD